MNNKVLSIVSKSGVLRKMMPKVGNMEMVAKKYAPEAYLVLGIGLGVAAAVSFAKAYSKHEEVFEEVIEDIQEIHDYIDIEVDEESDEHLSKKEGSVLLGKAYGRAFGTGVRLYGPSVLLASTSVYLLLTSHGIMKGRNKAVLAALQLMEQGFSTYRKRVVDDLGTEADERYYYGAEESVTNEVSVDEDGKKVKTKTKRNVLPETISPMIYSRVFDETNPNHVVHRDMNLFFLRSNERTFNDMLHIRGTVLLNDVYEALHFPRTKEGAVVGWSTKAGGDNFIDFGLDRDINTNHGDNRFVLDFNVNGVVFEYF